MLKTYCYRFHAPFPGSWQTVGSGPGTVNGLSDQMGQLSVSMGRGRGRGRGFMYGAVRQPALVGGLQPNPEDHQ